MVISIITLFPELYTPFLAASLIGRAQQQGKMTLRVSSLFDYSMPKADVAGLPGKRIDAPTYGHGSGMLIRPEVVERAIEEHEAQGGPAYKIFFSPQGELLDQDMLKELYTAVCERGGHLMLLPARYEGMDARVEAYYADKLVSIGDFVLMGGDLPAMVLTEGLTRLVPGVVGKQDSVEQESFSGAFVDYPEYTAPLTWKGMTVPDVVRSGNHKEIQEWREQQAAIKSVRDHFGWVRSHDLTPGQQHLVAQNIPPHYAILMHTQVMIPDHTLSDSDKPGFVEGTTSVTSLDIHDIARSATTYGIKGYFIVTPYADQQKIVHKLLDFWNSKSGLRYNGQRHEALGKVEVVSSFDEAYAAIVAREGKEPVIIGTSARSSEYSQHDNPITYYDQKRYGVIRSRLLWYLVRDKGLRRHYLSVVLLCCRRCRVLVHLIICQCVLQQRLFLTGGWEVIKRKLTLWFKGLSYES